MSKKTGIILGIILIVIGLVLAICGLISFFSASKNMNPENINPSEIFVSAGVGMVLIFVGVILIGAGGLIIYLASIGKIFSYMAKETAPGVEVSSHALGKGLASGVKKGLKQK